MLYPRVLAWTGFLFAFVFLTAFTVYAQTTILNVSYDVSRELYKDVNPAFIADWKAKTGETHRQSIARRLEQAGASHKLTGGDVSQ